MVKAGQPETSRLWRTICRWWKEIEVLIVTGATTAKVEAINTAIKHIKGLAEDSPTHATTKRVPCCAVPPEQRHEHPLTAEHSPPTVKSLITGHRSRGGIPRGTGVFNYRGLKTALQNSIYRVVSARFEGEERPTSSLAAFTAKRQPKQDVRAGGLTSAALEK